MYKQRLHHQLLLRGFTHRINGGWRHRGKGEGKLTMLISCLSARQDFPISLQRKQRPPAEGGLQNGVEGWLGVTVLRKAGGENYPSTH